ncbi:hypothetical protein OHA61_39730 [Streptomyces sp. NBC_00885]|uniref:hypothetical protein n=1 Tax=Streptomyces sp. NBC_00885 TaxID=2975857 RepID=UPI003863CA21|nr:hypothetical protein OHA61_00075 [Streptomyces sp. NBC_00885]WSY72138.1 hypothetical protein OHA61_39730 [Streptomyces sp. NBC_00885]
MPAVGRQERWAAAHSRYAARPAPDRAGGASVAATAPRRWVGEPVRVLGFTF